MNLYDPEGTWRAEMELRYARFRERELRGYTIRQTEDIDSGDPARALRWWSFFRFEAPRHTHLERPAYA